VHADVADGVPGFGEELMEGFVVAGGLALPVVADHAGAGGVLAGGYGGARRDAQRAGFNELKISNRRLKRLGQSRIKIKAGVLRRENLKLFGLWKRRRDRRAY